MHITAAAAAPTTLSPRLLRVEADDRISRISRISRLTRVGFSANPAFKAAIASDSEIRPVAGGKRISSRQPPRSAARSASAASRGVAGPPVASALMKSSLLRIASSDGSSPGPRKSRSGPRLSGPRVSDIVEPRSVDLRLQSRQGTMLGDPHGAGRAADGLGRLLGGHPHHDTKGQDLALLLRKYR